ncbi:MAG: hypothetical protein WCS99_03250 [Limisphaerales bacterium]
MKKTLIALLTICALGLIAPDLAHAKGKKDKSANNDRALADNAAAILAKYDADKDGKLSDAEIGALKKDYEANKTEILKRHDTNSDGNLDEAEISALKTTMASIPAEKPAKRKKKNKS